MIIVNESPIGGGPPPSTNGSWSSSSSGQTDLPGGHSRDLRCVPDASRMRHSLQTAKCPFLQADIKYLLDIRPI